MKQSPKGQAPKTIGLKKQTLKDLSSAPKDGRVKGGGISAPRSTSRSA